MECACGGGGGARLIACQEGDTEAIIAQRLQAKTVLANVGVGARAGRPSYVLSCPDSAAVAEAKKWKLSEEVPALQNEDSPGAQPRGVFKTEY